MPIILLWPKKLKPIVKFHNLELMIDSELQITKIFSVKVTLKIDQEKYLLILFWKPILGLIKIKI